MAAIAEKLPDFNEIQLVLRDAKQDKNADYLELCRQCENGEIVSKMAINKKGKTVKAYYINVNGVQSKHDNYVVEPITFICVHCGQRITNFDGAPKHKKVCPHWIDLLLKEKHDKATALVAIEEAKIEAARLRAEKAEKSIVDADATVGTTSPNRTKKTRKRKKKLRPSSMFAIKQCVPDTAFVLGLSRRTSTNGARSDSSFESDSSMGSTKSERDKCSMFG